MTEPPALPAMAVVSVPGHQRTARLVLGALLCGLGVWTVSGFLPAMAWAAVFAIGTWPLYRRARHLIHDRHNILLPLLFTLAVALVFVVPLGLVAVELGRESRSLAALLRQARTDGIGQPDWVAHVPMVSGQISAWWAANLAKPNAFNELFGRIDNSGTLQLGRTLGTQVARRATIFGFTLLTMFFLYRDGPNLVGQLQTASQRAVGPSGERLGRQMAASVRGTVNGLVLVGLAEGVVMGIAYAVAGAPHPTLLGAITGVAAILPLAAPVVFIVAAGLIAAQGSIVAAIAVLMLGFAVVLVADHVVRPVLIGGATHLPFLWVLFGILGGVESWGLLGLFVGPALMAALILLWREWIGHRIEA